jgi:hypothetical protein
LKSFRERKSFETLLKPSNSSQRASNTGLIFGTVKAIKSLSTQFVMLHI